MATWRDIVSGEYEPGAPVTAEWAEAVSVNPIAIAEGASGAPRIDPWAINPHFIGGGNEQGTNASGVVGLDSAVRLLLHVTMLDGTTSDAQNLEIRFTNDSGASWGAWQQFIPSILGQQYVSISIGIQGGNYRFVSTVGQGSGTLDVPSNADGFQLRMSSGTDNQYAFIAYYTGRVS